MAKRRPACPRISVTKNYRLFGRSDDNRPLDLKKHRKLESSMKRYGFLASYPIICYRAADKTLVVKDGQHRLAFAETLGLPVYYVVDDADFDVAAVNKAITTWKLADYALKHAANGLDAYQEGLDFAAQYKLPLGTAFALLAGTTSYTNVSNAFVDGTFTVKDRTWADAVASIYAPLVEMAPSVRGARFVEACMAVCRVEEFEPNRLIQNARRCREKLVSYSTKDAYLDALEEIYNFGRKSLVGLKAKAIMAMRARSACQRP